MSQGTQALAGQGGSPIIIIAPPQQQQSSQPARLAPRPIVVQRKSGMSTDQAVLLGTGTLLAGGLIGASIVHMVNNANSRNIRFLDRAMPVDEGIHELERSYRELPHDQKVHLARTLAEDSETADDLKARHAYIDTLADGRMPFAAQAEFQRVGRERFQLDPAELNQARRRQDFINAANDDERFAILQRNLDTPNAHAASRALAATDRESQRLAKGLVKLRYDRFFKPQISPELHERIRQHMAPLGIHL